MGRDAHFGVQPRGEVTGDQQKSEKHMALRREEA